MASHLNPEAREIEITDYYMPHNLLTKIRFLLCKLSIKETESNYNKILMQRKYLNTNSRLCDYLSVSNSLKNDSRGKVNNNLFQNHKQKKSNKVPQSNLFNGWGSKSKSINKNNNFQIFAIRKYINGSVFGEVNNTEYSENIYISPIQKPEQYKTETNSPYCKLQLRGNSVKNNTFVFQNLSIQSFDSGALPNREKAKKSMYVNLMKSKREQIMNQIKEDALKMRLNDKRNNKMSNVKSMKNKQTRAKFNISSLQKSLNKY